MVFSGEAHPIYAETLRRNHDALRAIRKEQDLTPGDYRPIDLRDTGGSERDYGSRK